MSSYKVLFTRLSGHFAEQACGLWSRAAPLRSAGAAAYLPGGSRTGGSSALEPGASFAAPSLVKTSWYRQKIDTRTK